MDTLVLDLPSIEEAEYAKQVGKKIGRGAYRAVYRIPGSRWAYKFEHSEYNRDSGANKREYDNYSKRRSSLPEGVDFPEMELLPNNVIAVEFVEGVLGKEIHSWEDRDYDYVEICMCESHRAVKCWKKAVKGIDMRDLHGGNVMVRKDGKVIIIDIGEYGNETDNRW